MIAVDGSRYATLGITIRPAPSRPRLVRAVRVDRDDDRLEPRRLPPDTDVTPVNPGSDGADGVVAAVVSAAAGASPHSSQNPSWIVTLQPGCPQGAA